MTAQETIDEEQEADGTSAAQCTIGSRIVSLKLAFQLTTPSSAIYRWLLWKKPDGEDLLANIGAGLKDGAFHSADDTASLRELRKVTLAKGVIVPDTAGARGFLKIYVKRKALARVARMSENDSLVLSIANSLGTEAGKLHGFGNIYVSQE